MIDIYDLRDHIVKPTLSRLGMYSKWAERLVIGTAMAESVVNNDMKLVQINGPAVGIYQMEPFTHNDIYKNYVYYNPKIDAELTNLTDGTNRTSDRMIWDLRYATAMCRVHYWRQSFDIPNENDIEALAKIWKLHYNSNLGKGTIEGFIEKTQGILLL